MRLSIPVCTKMQASHLVVMAMTGMMAICGLAAQGQTETPSPTLKMTPLRELASTQPKDGDQYELGSGDEITLTVIGRPELSGLHTIGPDGRITLPIAGSVTVGGLSRDDASDAIVKSLSKYYETPAATITVTKYGSNRILLLGDIEHPGPQYFDGSPTLLEAVTRGGALLSGDKNKRMPTMCYIYRGNNQIGEINLKQVAQSGDIRLRRNDTIYVPGDNERLISILGEVKNPGPVVLKEDSTLVTLLADAGGITEQAGNPEIHIFNPNKGTVAYVHFKDLIRPKGSEVSLVPGDIVYVPRSGLARFGYVMQQLAPMAQIGTVGVLAATR